MHRRHFSLLAVDSSPFCVFQGKMGDKHPLVWTHDHDGARVFYTALGHHSEAYEKDAKIIGMLRGGMRYCLNLKA